MTDKESANCRLEANYAHQQELDMVPLMLTEGFRPKGWLGLILGTRMWYAFWDADQDEDAAFEGRLDAVVREIGDRGKLMLPEAVTRFDEPTPAPAPAPQRGLAPAPAAAAAAAPAPSAAPVMKRPAPATPRPHHRTPPTRSFTPSMRRLLPDPVGGERQQQEMVEMQPGGEYAVVPAGSPLSEAFYLQMERASERAAAADRAAERALVVERERADRLERASAVDRLERASAAAAAAERSEYRFMVGAAATCTAAAVVGVAAVVARTQR